MVSMGGQVTCSRGRREFRSHMAGVEGPGHMWQGLGVRSHKLGMGGSGHMWWELGDQLTCGGGWGVKSLTLSPSLRPGVRTGCPQTRLGQREQEE